MKDIVDARKYWTDQVSEKFGLQPDEKDAKISSISLQKILEYYEEQYHLAEIETCRWLEIVFLGDGRRVHRNLSTIQLAIRIVPCTHSGQPLWTQTQGKHLPKATDLKGLFPIAILQCLEKYEELKALAAGIFSEMHLMAQDGFTSTKSNKHYPVFFSCVGDLKWQLLIHGQNDGSEDFHLFAERHSTCFQSLEVILVLSYNHARVFDVIALVENYFRSEKVV